MKGAIIVSKDLLRNNIFDEHLNVYKYDGRTYRFITLREELQRNNIDLHTQDFFKNKKPDFAIFLDDIYKDDFNLSISKKFLIAFEPPIILNSNHNKDLLLKKYSKVFTWNDSLVDDINFIKFYLSFNLNNIDIPEETVRKKNITMICENKKSYKQNELYSERQKIINWYEKNDPSNFDLYGRGWNKYVFGRRPFTYLNRFNSIGLLLKIFDKKYSVYKGPIQKKNDVLKKYNFSFCYENSHNLNGYISEKIFDCFFSYTIPIYKGASNINSLIPKELFINADDFKDISDLNKYIKSIKNDKLIKKRLDIYEYLNSQRVNVFSSEYNAKIIAGEISKSLISRKE